jgi:hypothetical protein
VIPSAIELFVKMSVAVKDFHSLPSKEKFDYKSESSPHLESNGAEQAREAISVINPNQ